MPQALDPRGPAAARTADLWWLMFWLAVAVFLAVLFLLSYALFKASRAGPRPAPRTDDNAFIVLAGVVFPLPIIFVVMVASISAGSDLAAPPETPALTIEVVGHQFWWEVRYPEHGVVAANEIHLPVGVPVELHLTAADVIHSFWVPRLGTKMDLVPGRTNSVWIQADEPGTYRGQCAEFCGIQHALMGLLVIAEPEDDFAAWLDHHAQPAVEPVDDLSMQGQAVFLQAGCSLCHAIRGFAELEHVGAPGPDLTHFASRQTIGAATVENTRANLTAWVINPHTIKPGNRMPPTQFVDPEQLNALIAYLESLD